MVVASPVDFQRERRRQGIERRATATAGRHESLLPEARFDAPAFAARVMLDAARGLARLGPGAHHYALR